MKIGSTITVAVHGEDKYGHFGLKGGRKVYVSGEEINKGNKYQISIDYADQNIVSGSVLRKI